ncbi:hypothetical protein RJ639_039785 [Escallonia herrerae]|uniref:Exoribonuclease phosphorolytic domain-containing protein n=1 Tax=Escallonia herrerae TaxID=1293975 RepID=A0AA89B6K0_9ASTE|nr:hypothetical protein RJ639_039785 [Escallonia herrerae]
MLQNLSMRSLGRLQSKQDEKPKHLYVPATCVLKAVDFEFLAALTNTRVPVANVPAGASLAKDPDVDLSSQETTRIDTSGVPVIVTLTKVGRRYIVDATSEEESQMSSAVSVSINKEGRICGLTKQGGASLDPSVIIDMISVANHVIEPLMSKLDSEIAAAEADKQDI